MQKAIGCNSSEANNDRARREEREGNQPPTPKCGPQPWLRLLEVNRSSDEKLD